MIDATDLPALMARMRAAQAKWAARSVRERLHIVRRLRHRIAAAPEPLIESVTSARARDAAEILTSEIIPLADACRFLEREAGRLLAARRPGRRGRQLWLAGVRLQIRREPYGLVLILAPDNYPLFLPGVQMLQALVAGNAVLVKPAPGCARPLAVLARNLEQAGLAKDLCHILDENVETARAAIDAGVDKAALTGSAATGQAVLADLAPRLVPATLELSGNDAVFVLPDADVEQVAAALAFGLRLNGGRTCIAPRRVFVLQERLDELENRLTPRLRSLEPVVLPVGAMQRTIELLTDARRHGAQLCPEPPTTVDAPLPPILVRDATPEMPLFSADIMAPVLMLIPVADMNEALTLNARCPYGLGAAVFGPEPEAAALAERLRAGTVVINDLIVPTADPRLPFGGRGESGYGVTRGGAGLLEWTTIKAISVRRGRLRPHYDTPHPNDPALFSAWLKTAHGRGAGTRLAAATRLLRNLVS
jgi:acyl-CoA reductase-like NAD-dependent aldehyde dehydrogenase